ncbi:hypothetical protein EWM64_g593 [Hericium alpestre]|uniref:Uncharacterized protein n=1 Tax=Hericium alpestre TaxID=135208 RepID=A0A4Z0A8M8_9AGAM|nr:hypothetical protein EWM64_g593 [Hericium alpestre]
MSVTILTRSGRARATRAGGRSPRGGRRRRGSGVCIARERRAAVSEKDLDALFDLVHEEELGDADSLVAVCSPWLGASKSFESDYSDLCSPLEEGERAEEGVEMEVENTRLAEFLHALWKERHGGEGVAQDEWRALGTIVEEEGA